MIHILWHSFVLCLLWTSFASESLRGQQVLFVSAKGTLSMGTVTNLATKYNRPDAVVVTVKGRNESGFNTSSPHVVNISDLTVATDSLDFISKSKTHKIRKGQIILSKEKKIFYVEAVFPDGRIAASEVSPHSQARPNVKVGGDFVRKDQPISIFDRNEVMAVEMPCYGSYCKNQSNTQLNRIPVCDSKALEKFRSVHSLSEEQIPIFRSCRRDEKLAAVFNDGTMIFADKMLNPFEVYPQGVIQEAEAYVSP